MSVFIWCNVLPHRLPLYTHYCKSKFTFLQTERQTQFPVKWDAINRNETWVGLLLILTFFTFSIHSSSWNNLKKSYIYVSLKLDWRRKKTFRMSEQKHQQEVKNTSSGLAQGKALQGKLWKTPKVLQWDVWLMVGIPVCSWKGCPSCPKIGWFSRWELECGKFQGPKRNSERNISHEFISFTNTLIYTWLHILRNNVIVLYDINKWVTW